MTRKKIKAKQEKKERKSLAIKKKKVLSVSKIASKYPVIALIDIRNLPDRILQSSKKKLRGKAEFAIAKNTVIKRALEKAGKKELAKSLNFPTALVLTSLSPYSLFQFFANNKVKVAAKPGQVAESDITVPEGETDLPPGPALSELKGAGINVQIRGGKIVVAMDSTVAKAGAKISDKVCKALQKLNILPFEAMVNMVAAYDGKYHYTSDMLDIGQKKLFAGLLECLHQAFNISTNLSFPTQQNIEALLTNALQQSQNMAINGMVYSDASTELLLANAVSLGEDLSGKVGSLEKEKPAEEKPKEAEKPGEKASEKPEEKKPAEKPKEGEKPEAKPDKAPEKKEEKPKSPEKAGEKK